MMVLTSFLIAASLASASSLKSKLHLPSGKPSVSDIPLVVMLHRCDETADDFAALTGMNDLADRDGFAVLYPEQDRTRNPTGCWNWHVSPGRSPGSNEGPLLSSLIDQIRKDNGLKGNVFVAGLSAGGAMAGYLATCYPRQFEAAALHSSVSYLRAGSVSAALELMSKKRLRKVDERLRCPAFERKPILVIQGQMDTVVNPNNAQAVLSDLGSLDTQSALLSIPALEHAWSGGVRGIRYSEPKGPSASEFTWKYFQKMDIRGP